MVCGLTLSIHAQEVTDPTDSQPARFDAPSATPEIDDRTASEPAPTKQNDRIFGVLPNYSPLEGAIHAQPISVRGKFRMAELNSMDPYVSSFVGVVSAFGGGQGRTSYAQRYTTALADNMIGNFMTTAVLPAAFHQDPRYFESGQGSVWHRAGYALSRVAVTRGGSGTSQFNLSEIGGKAVAAGVSNLYYSSADRSIANTLTRWGTQVMWDMLSNELKEFWPDIRREIRKH